MSIVLDDALSQYLEYNGDVASGSGDTRTLSAWIKSDDLTINQGVVSIDDDLTSIWVLLLRGAIAGDYVGAGLHEGAAAWAIADTAVAYTTDSWIHILAVFHSLTDRRAFISGGSKGTNTDNLSGGTVDKTKIGAYGAKAGTYFSGKIAEVAIWGTNLSDAQGARLTAGDLPSTIESSSLKGWWKLYDDYLDSSGNDFTMVGYNSPTFSSDHPTVGAGASFEDKVYSKKLIAVGNNEVWHESAAGTMSELAAANGSINTDNPLTVAEAFQKVFVANQTNLKIADFANTKIATDDLNTHAPDRGNILTGGTSGAKMVVDYITSVTVDAACDIYGLRTTTATFASGETVTGTDDDDNSITFVLSAAETAPPHWYDWTTWGNDTTNFGSMPSSAYLVARYRGRLVLSGHPNYPHQWYMAKVSNPFNWKYGSTDPLTAVAGNNVDAGEIGDIVRALIPYGDDFLIFGCADSIHILDGDPAFGGSIDELSNITGMYGPWAWCKDEDGNLYFWGSGGLYKMEGGRSKPRNISQGHLPKWVDDWAAVPATHRIVLTYDPSRNGIIISKVTLADGTNLNYWYDLRTEGFYPETYPTNCGIFSSWYYDSDASGTRELILGTNDGYLRSFYDNKKDDYGAGTGGTTISSYAALPIIKLNEAEDSEGKLTSLTIELAGGLILTKLTHTALTTAHAKGDTLTQATSAATMVVSFTNTAKTITYGYLTTGTFNTTNAVTGNGSGTGFTPTAVGTGDFSDTDGVSYELHVGDDAETVLENIRDGAPARESGTLSGAGRKNRIRKRVRGRWLGIKLYNSTEAETWAVNLISGEVKPAGKIKS